MEGRRAELLLCISQAPKRGLRLTELGSAVPRHYPTPPPCPLATLESSSSTFSPFLSCKPPSFQAQPSTSAPAWFSKPSEPRSPGRAQAALTWQLDGQTDVLLFVSQHVPVLPSHYRLLPVLQLLISPLAVPPLASDLAHSALAGAAGV